MPVDRWFVGLNLSNPSHSSDDADHSRQNMHNWGALESIGFIPHARRSPYPSSFSTAGSFAGEAVLRRISILWCHLVAIGLVLARNKFNVDCQGQYAMRQRLVS